MTDRSPTPHAFGAYRRKQRLRIEFEAVGGVRRDVRRRHRILDPLCAPEQQTADLAIRVRTGMAENDLQQRLGNAALHHHIAPVMDRGGSVIEACVPAEAIGWRLDRALAAAMPNLSRERLKTLISSGQVALAGMPVRDPASKAAPGPYAVAVPAPTQAHNEAQEIPLVVAYEDEHLIVVDKPPGLVVHPAAGNLDGTLVNALLHHCRGELSGIGGVARPGIVHRIDKDTSGLIVAAKHDKAHEGLAAQFKRHSIDRRYLAITSGVPKQGSGTVDAPLARSPRDRKKMAIVESANSRHAITHWRVIESLHEAALVECRLETGRTHQVRVHLQSIGHPLLGDPVYGRTRPAHQRLLKELGFHRQALHAARLGFVHPVTSETMAFESKMPADMQALFSRL